MEDATAAIVDVLAARGFALLPPDGDEGVAPRRLALYLDGSWVVVVDEDRLPDDPPWAADLSRALGGTGQRALPSLCQRGLEGAELSQ